MLGVFIGLVVAVWFSRTAGRTGQGTLAWGVVGFLSVMLPGVVFANGALYLMARIPSMNEPSQPTGVMWVLILGLPVAGWGLGFLGAHIVRTRILLKRAVSPVSLRG